MLKIKAALIAFLIAASVLSTQIFPAYALAAGSSVVIDSSSIDSGIVKVKTEVQSKKRIKLMIEKGNKSYTYNLKNDGAFESFPLQMGNGEYKVSVMENLSGTKYKVVSKENVKLDLKNQKAVYLNSIQIIDWDNSETAVKLAGELTEGLNRDEDKVKAIYDYLVKNMKYDYEKLDKLSNDYLPDIDNALENKKGICYDYSSLFASMLRSSGIPAKLVKGYSSNVKGYHAWNEVYLAGSDKWLIIDTTYDSQLSAAGKKTEMPKDSKHYTKVNEY